MMVNRFKEKPDAAAAKDETCRSMSFKQAMTWERKRVRGVGENTDFEIWEGSHDHLVALWLSGKGHKTDGQLEEVLAEQNPERWLRILRYCQKHLGTD